MTAPSRPLTLATLREVLLGIVPESRGGNPHVNALLRREPGRVFSGIKLVLTRFQRVDIAELSDFSV